MTTQIKSGVMAANSITATQIAANSITASAIASDAIVVADIANNSITSAKIAANAVDSAELVSGSIDTVHLSADAVTGAKIADDSIDSEHYVDGSIDTAHIADSQVTNAKLANSSVTVNSNSLSLGGTLTLDTDDIGEGSTNLYYTDARAQAVSINNLSEDTTPQLGGTLDTNGNLVQFGDSANAADDRLQFGASQDLQIYHDGSNSYITDSGTGNLKIGGANVEITTAGGIKYFEGASSIVRLYHTGNEKLATTSSGINVTGTLTADGLDIEGTTSTDATTAATAVSEAILRVKPHADTGNSLWFSLANSADPVLQASNFDGSTLNDILLNPFGGNVTISEYLYHNGNTGTNLRFQTDRATLTSGGGASVDAHSNGNLYLTGTTVQVYGNYNSTGTIGSDKITVTHSGTVPLDLHGSATGISYISLANTATAATNNGSGIEFRANSSTQERQVGYITAKFTNTTDASRESQITFQTASAGSQVTPLYLQGEDATFANDVTVSGNLYVTGSSTAVNVEDLNVEQGEITLNYSTGDSSASANGSGIRIQDAVNSTTDATILWDATNDTFDFSHGIDLAGNLSVNGTNVLQSSGNNLVNIGVVTATGLIKTNSHVQSGNGSGGVALTVNDGYGNANVTFNHLSGTPEQNGNSARIEVNTDTSGSAAMYFEIKSAVSSGVAVQTDTIMSIDDTGLKIESGKVLYSNGDMVIEANDTDFVVKDSTDSTTNFLWRDWSASKLYLGTADAVATLRSTLDLNTNDITNAGNIEMGSGYIEKYNSELNGYIVGGYNSITGNNSKSNPIYAIGSNYTPSSETENGTSFYGIGFTRARGSGGGSYFSGLDWTLNTGWGLYCAAAGVESIFLDANNGDINWTGSLAHNGTRVMDSSRNLVNIGNLTLSGTVDGRDVATDGTKLDTIATNADVTPSWVPSSDPGYLTSASTQTKYLRSDTSDTFSGGTLTIQAPTDGTGVFITKAVDSPDEPAALVIASDADSEDDLAFEIRGNATGTSVDLSTTMSSTDTTFAVFASGHTTIGYSSLGTSYSPVNAYGLNVNGTISAVSGYYAGSTQVINSSGNWVGGGNISEFTNDSGYLTGITSSQVTTALGYTPYQESTALSATSGDFSGTISCTGNNMQMTNTGARVKYSVWSTNTYGIGMETGYTFGGIANDYVMSFQMSNTASRGFWWGDASHTNAQGAMALTTEGYLTVAAGIRVGYGETDTTTPGAGLDVQTTADASPAIIATNTGGVGSIIQRWVGDSDSMEMQCTGTGDYKLVNTQQLNGINFYDGTGGIEIQYNGSVVQAWNSTGGTNLASGNFQVGGTTVIDSSRNLTIYRTLTNDTGTILDSDGASNYIKGGSGGSGILYTQASTFYCNNQMYLNTGRGVVYFENNTYSNADGAGVTLRTGTNPSSGSIFDVRSSGQACRLFVGQSISSSGTNPFYAGCSSSTSGQETVSNYAIELATNGNITATGNVTAYGTVSDIRQKENIEQIDQPIERLQKIKGITFNYKKKSEDERLMGVIAQELLEDDILKLAVYEHEDFKAEEDDPLKHTYGVKYEHLTAILIEAVKEQQKQIEELKEEVSSLRSKN